MPAKYSRKTYLANGYYHIYNRGVEKRKIFTDKQDYGVYLSYLKTYLTEKKEQELQAIIADPDEAWANKDKSLKLLRMNNFYGEIELLAYCLMPNHFHLIVKQEMENGIDTFMNSLNTRYVMYFNRKMKRVGPLYQGVYKAVLVESDEQLLHLSWYIHRNPSPQGHALQKMLRQPSSLPEYIGVRESEWVNTSTVTALLSKQKRMINYQKYVLGTVEFSKSTYAVLMDS